ncbi:hypothetical protein BCR32DRAFT_286275 [Anaeromyces robustus]|uniref:Uncharacterized protein n=1 Tax=Anaeromyces robustus TaxID=1754192 RepID=A0A1Y1W0E7_9FUNG|nr:hypothetical protein BCR32DRAFT_286275 [Anaeromyces robustus]|eukprot:ORX66988.1 hypothetical protein BCR32DRAFT_286275 [Anaeromyces robustus]
MNLGGKLKYNTCISFEGPYLHSLHIKNVKGCKSKLTRYSTNANVKTNKLVSKTPKTIFC